jgi:type IV pilus assembly protein PilB
MKSKIRPVNRLRPVNRITDSRLGELLIQSGVINITQLNEALAIQKKNGNNNGNKKLSGEILVELGFTDDRYITQAFSTQYRFPYLPLDNYNIDQDITNTISAKVARKYLLIPIDKIGDSISIAMSNPLDEKAIRKVETATNCSVQAFIATPSDIKKKIDQHYNGNGKK